ncbi:unnamed protein product [Urochloa decumbens]|uniref:Uncharacterized protein n=1 Tax=Urochloa decumbens TaxID=240449 RepID=A0ABC9GBR4_9POAL
MAAAVTTKKKRTELVMVHQGYIDWILTKREVLACQPIPSLSDEFIAGVFRDKPELRERLRRDVAEMAALLKKLQDEDDDILEQYHAKGYAMQEIEIGEEEEDYYSSRGHRSRR